MPPEPRHDLRVLILAPIGRDAALTVELLSRAGVLSETCHSVAEICEGIRGSAGAVLLTEEAVYEPGIAELAATLAEQPAWSDISILLFAGDERSDAVLHTLQTLEVLRNVTLLDRPVGATAVVSTVRAALRGRLRQYELRDVLLALRTAREDAERARDEAQTANRLKDEFLATLSHELRTPLNAILGWVSLLRQRRVAPERVAKVLEIIERNARSQAQLVADVLDVSRMITGRVRLRLEPVVLSHVVRDAADSVRPAADARRIHIAVDDPGGLPVIAGDPERLQQVLWNLLSNAIKFTPPDGRIDVSLEAGDDHVRVSVSDTGVGMPREFLPHAFERFRQADQSFTRPHGGLGLGLAIVKHLVETHGGEVRVTSEGVGRGARFDVRLPVATGFGDRTQPVRLDDAECDLPTLSGQLVLVVDDDPATRDLMSAALVQCSARVVCADSAVEAFRLLDEEIPAIIVSDLGMAEQDGLAMMQAIRARPDDRGGRVPAIALSAYARAEDRSAAIAAGFDDFLTKPAKPGDVIRAVDRWLAARTHTGGTA